MVVPIYFCEVCVVKEKKEFACGKSFGPRLPWWSGEQRRKSDFNGARAPRRRTDKPTWLGTGFLIDGQCTFATAKHVIQDLAQGESLVLRQQVPEEHGQVLTYPARVLYRDEIADIAFVKEPVGEKLAVFEPDAR